MQDKNIALHLYSAVMSSSGHLSNGITTDDRLLRRHAQCGEKVGITVKTAKTLPYKLSRKMARSGGT